MASVIGNLGNLVSTSVLLMAIAYFATSASIFPLSRRNRRTKFTLRGDGAVPVLGALSSLFLISQCTIDQMTVGAILVLMGIVIYVKYTPKKEMTELREALLSRETVLEWAHRQERIFLANPLRHLKRWYRRITQRK